jgi:hypothetical protein
VLAQINPDTVQLAGGAASLFFFIGGVNAILKLVDRLRGQPPVEHLKVIADDMNKRLCHLEAQRELDVRQQEERRRALYSHVDKTRLELKEDIKALDAKVGVMPAEVVALLRNTGAMEGRKK